MILFGERASSDTDNLSKSWQHIILAVEMAQEHKVVSDTGGAG